MKSYREWVEEYVGIKVTDEQVEEFLREDAKREGISFNAYCIKYGIVGPAQRLKIKRHEVPLEGKAS